MFHHNPHVPKRRTAPRRFEWPAEDDNRHHGAVAGQVAVRAAGEDESRDDCDHEGRSEESEESVDGCTVAWARATRHGREHGSDIQSHLYAHTNPTRWKERVLFEPVQAPGDDERDHPEERQRLGAGPDAQTLGLRSRWRFGRSLSLRIATSVESLALKTSAGPTNNSVWPPEPLDRENAGNQKYNPASSDEAEVGELYADHYEYTPAASHGGMWERGVFEPSSKPCLC